MRSTLPLPLVGLLATAGLATAAQPATTLRNHARDVLMKRDRCGPDVGSCPTGWCCSEYGWCGTTTEHCTAGCQSAFGYCSSDDKGEETGSGGGGGAPGGGGTLGVPRPRFGKVPYGVSIATCSVPGTMALTFDDGPFEYTAALLDILKRHDAAATFFVNGRNFGDASLAPYPDILRRMVVEGHQVASHTHTHPDLSTISQDARRAQMADLEKLFSTVLGGYFPTYMRPPFGSCNPACTEDMKALGYHIITWDIDTLDYANASPTAIKTSMNIFDDAVVPVTADRDGGVERGYISLAHDVHRWTVESLAEHMLTTAKERGYRLVTVGECLGDDKGNWYRDGVTGLAVGGGGQDGGETETPTGSATPTSTSTPTTTTTSKTTSTSTAAPTPTPVSPDLVPSVDSSCAATSGGKYTCAGSVWGDCCSQWGWW